MPMTCCAIGCKSRRRNKSRLPPDRQHEVLSFHRFPFSNMPLLNEWVKAVKRKDFWPSTTSSLCSKHFQESDFVERTRNRMLKPTAVPSVFDFSKHLVIDTDAATITVGRSLEDKKVNGSTKRRGKKIDSSAISEAFAAALNGSPAGQRRIPCSVGVQTSKVCGPSVAVQTDPVLVLSDQDFDLLSVGSENGEHMGLTLNQLLDRDDWIRSGFVRHRCQICGAAFADPFQLKLHKWVHPMAMQESVRKKDLEGASVKKKTLKQGKENICVETMTEMDWDEDGCESMENGSEQVQLEADVHGEAQREVRASSTQINTDRHREVRASSTQIDTDRHREVRASSTQINTDRHREVRASSTQIDTDRHREVRASSTQMNTDRHRKVRASSTQIDTDRHREVLASLAQKEQKKTPNLSKAGEVGKPKTNVLKAGAFDGHTKKSPLKIRVVVEPKRSLTSVVRASQQSLLQTNAVGRSTRRLFRIIKKEGSMQNALPPNRGSGWKETHMTIKTADGSEQVVLVTSLSETARKKKESHRRWPPDARMCPVCGSKFNSYTAMRFHLSSHLYYDIQREEILMHGPTETSADADIQRDEILMHGPTETSADADIQREEILMHGPTETSADADIQREEILMHGPTETSADADIQREEILMHGPTETSADADIQREEILMHGPTETSADADIQREEILMLQMHGPTKTSADATGVRLQGNTGESTSAGEQSQAQDDHTRTGGPGETGEVVPFSHSSVAPSDFSYVCELCNIGFMHRRELINHRDATHKSEVNWNKNRNALVLKRAKETLLKANTSCVCDVCGAVMRRACGLANHMRKHRNKHQCDICHSDFCSSSSLKKHKRLHSEGQKAAGSSTRRTPTVCEVCGKSFKKIKLHMATHTGEQIYKCGICQAAFSSQTLLTKHKDEQHQEKHFACQVCGKTYRRFQDLKTHRFLKHVLTDCKETGPYHCERCGKKCHSRNMLQYHINTHTGEKPYKCEFCPKSFCSPNTLKSHQLNHTGDSANRAPCARVPCPYCPKTFANNNVLKMHIRSHTGENMLTCNVCGKGFAYPNTFKLHMRRHRGEKPHECDVCHRRFTRGATLRVHYRIHTGEKPYPCSVCGQRFRQIGDMKAHVKRHGKTGSKTPSVPAAASQTPEVAQSSQVHNVRVDGQVPDVPQVSDVPAVSQVPNIIEVVGMSKNITWIIDAL